MGCRVYTLGYTLYTLHHIPYSLYLPFSAFTGSTCPRNGTWPTSIIRATTETPAIGYGQCATVERAGARSRTAITGGRSDVYRQGVSFSRVSAESPLLELSNSEIEHG